MTAQRSVPRLSSPHRHNVFALAIWLSCAGVQDLQQSIGTAAKAATTSTDTEGYELSSARKASGGLSTSPQPSLVARAATTHLARLNHTQYRNTIEDLLLLSEPPSLTFAPDARTHFGFDTSNALQVDGRLGPQYRAMAETMAERITVDDELYARLVPCSEPLALCRDQFIDEFGLRAFRHPLTDEQRRTLASLFNSGRQTVPGQDAFRLGVALVVEAALQMPDFLYRLDQRVAASDEATSTAADFAIASRLSYFLFDSMPDSLLFAQAQAGQLHTAEQVAAQARRMLQQPRVLDKLVAFHEQAWHLERAARISPDPEQFSSVPTDLVRRVRQSTRLFLLHVIQSGGGLEELLTAPFAYVDDGLAPLYDVDKPAPGQFVLAEFPPEVRRGLLMQVGYLASNAYARRSDPIHRGLFVIRDLLCRQMPDPPPGSTDRPLPPSDEPIVTTRDEVALLTSQSFCPACHQEINAPGFAFEGFDALGRVRSEDNGQVVDTTGHLMVDGQSVFFQGPGQLVRTLSQSREAHNCYTRRWLEFALGRRLAQTDAATLQQLGSQSLPLADLLIGIVTSPPFLQPLTTTPVSPPDPSRTASVVFHP